MTKEAELLTAIEAAELSLNYVLVFRQETGEEAVVHGMSVSDAIIRYPEWSYSHSEMVRDAAYYQYEEALREYEFWQDTKDMTDEEYEDYLDSLNHDYELDDY